MLNVPAVVSEAAQEKLLDALVPRALGGEGDAREREAVAWPLALVIRRHAEARTQDTRVDTSCDVCPLSEGRLLL